MLGCVIIAPADGGIRFRKLNLRNDAISQGIFCIADYMLSTEYTQLRIETSVESLYVVSDKDSSVKKTWTPLLAPLHTVRLEWMKGLGNPPNIWVPWYCKLAICKLFCGEIEFVSLCLRKIWAPWYTIFGNPEIQNTDLLVLNVAYYESDVWFQILWLHLLAELPNCLTYANPDLKNPYF